MTRVSNQLGSPAPAPKRSLPPALAANIWRPGQSGNPSGNSGTYGEVVKLARLLSVRAIERLGELVESTDERVAAVACQAILDRAFGRPRPTIEKQETLEDRIEAMSPEERRARLRELTEKALSLVQDGNGPVIQVEVEAVAAKTIKAGNDDVDG
jgi:hypothetical protein